MKMCQARRIALAATAGTGRERIGAKASASGIAKMCRGERVDEAGASYRPFQERIPG